MVDRLRNAADYTKLVQEVSSDYLHEVTAKSPEYLLEIMAQIVEVFLAKLNIPLKEVDTFTSQIKERNMGELFAHFEGWDVQAIRKEAREEAWEEARIQVTETDIQKLLAVLHKLGCSRETVIEQLVEQYQMIHETAAKKVDDFWDRR